jgi:hypothetical protein
MAESEGQLLLAPAPRFKNIPVGIGAPVELNILAYMNVSHICDRDRYRIMSLLLPYGEQMCLVYLQDFLSFGICIRTFREFPHTRLNLFNPDCMQGRSLCPQFYAGIDPKPAFRFSTVKAPLSSMNNDAHSRDEKRILGIR